MIVPLAHVAGIPIEETLASFGPVLFLALTALFSGSALTLYSLSVSHVNDKLEPAQMVDASSALLMMNGMAAAAGPVLAGSLIHAFGPRAYFATLGTLTGALTIYDLWRKSRRSAVPRALKGPFINTQQIVTCAGLDPGPAGHADAARGARVAPSGPVTAAEAARSSP